MPGRLQEEIKDPYPIEVEYLPDNPLVSRIKGYGEDTVRNWLWHNVVLGSLAFLVIASPGIILLKSAFGKTRPVERSTGRPYTKEQLDHSTRILISGGGTEKAALESQAYLEQAPTEDESDSISPTAQKEELAKALGVPVEGLDAKLAELGSGVSRVTPGTPEDVAVRAEAIQNNLGKASEEQKARLAKAFEVPVEQLDTYLAELKARINARFAPAPAPAPAEIARESPTLIRASELNADKSFDDRDLDPEKRARLAKLLGVSEDEIPEALEHL